MDDQSLFLSIAELTERFADGRLDPAGVAEHHLARIARIEPVLAAFQMVDAEQARRMAAAAAARWRAGAPLSALDGVPVTIKDNVDVAGWPTRNATRSG